MYFSVFGFYLIFPLILIYFTQISIKPKLFQVLWSATDWIQIAYLYDIFNTHGHSIESHKQAFQIYLVGFLAAAGFIVLVPLMKKKAVLQICSALSALGAITGLSPHLTWVYVSRILMATSSTTSVLLNANDEHFWVTFAGTGMITLVATHLGIVVFSFSPLVPLWISLLASIFSFFSILRQTEDPGRSYKLKDYIPALKSLIKLSNASKIVSQALFESCFTILTILWNPMMFELSNDDTKVPSGLLVATFACCMLTGVLLFHNLKTKFQETRINLFSIISMMVLMFLMKSLCFHCIEIDGVAVFLMCLAWITSGVYFASKKPQGDLRDVISLITLSLLNGLIVYMTQNNFYNVILNASFLLSLGASLVAGPGFLKSSGSEGTTYVTI